MRTPTFFALGALTISAILVGCSGSSVSPAAPAAATETAAPASPTPPSPAATSVPTAAPSAAPTREIGLAGFLAPGTYRYSQRDPAVTFTVPKDWVMTEAMPLHFGLRPAAFPADNSVRTWYDMRVASRDPSCPEIPEPTIGHTAVDLTDAFQHRPGVRSTGGTDITLGGLAGTWFDLRVDESWTEPCPFTDGMPATTLFTDDLHPDDPAFWGLAGYDERMRVIVLDDGAGSNIVITIDAVDPATFEDLVAAAMPVIESYDFDG